ncbi:MAG: aminotransferase class I/II-fold pyridoxal phosphate-dependent enzyme [Hyphomonadaceae bacterium]|nr:aminotransferase class I/II-fold pyridoxal phosphate-dependent enzyme [Clostridia bacterium]
MSQNHTPLYDALLAMHEKNITPFDVPGHKRGRGVPEMADFIGRRALALDVNSMPDLDNLNYPTGVIAQAQDLMAQAFGADEAFFTVNGTTLAVHGMIMSVCGPGDKILLPRNVHKSVINALILCDAFPVYMQAEVSQPLKFATGVTLDNVKQAIDENLDAKAIFLINPTYYGVCAHLQEIVEYAHSKDIVVLVDEAHGAHFPFHPQLPKSAMACGADMSAVSIHKTGGALTQASAILLKEGRVKKETVRTILNIFHTTSASYLLMVSLDIARKNLALNGHDKLAEILSLVRVAREQLNLVDGLYAWGQELIGAPGVCDFDETKLGINVEALGLTGYEVYDILLYDYNIQMELADSCNVLAIVSLGDSKESLDILVNALREVTVKFRRPDLIPIHHVPLKNPKVIITPRQAFYSNKRFVPLEQAEGEIIGESVMVYPPGIPILAPGEEVTKEIITYLQFLKEQDSKLTDMNDKTLNNLYIVDRR